MVTIGADAGDGGRDHRPLLECGGPAPAAGATTPLAAAKTAGTALTGPPTADRSVVHMTPPLSAYLPLFRAFSLFCI